MRNWFSKRNSDVMSAVLCVKCKTSCECGCVGASISLYQRKLSLISSHAAILLFFVFSLLNVVQSATQITGTVLDADTKAPLKNAMVSLKSTGDLVLTNENGGFTLTKTDVATIKTSKATSVEPYILNRNHLQLNITNPNSSVQLVLLNLNGQIIYKTTKTLQPGSHDIDLLKLLSTNSIYIVQLKINNTNYITKILPIADSPIVSSHSSPPSVWSSRCLAVSSPETLLVSKYLYIPTIAPIAATNTISLQRPSTPPPPPAMQGT